VSESKLEYWWGLSYASWLQLPRVLIQEMSTEWQDKLADLLTEFDEEFPNKIDETTHVAFKKSGRFVRGPDWLMNYRYPNVKEIKKMRSKS
jgi:hypothetical protein